MSCSGTMGEQTSPQMLRALCLDTLSLLIQWAYWTVKTTLQLALLVDNVLPGQPCAILQGGQG